jgi:hypothetical protein
MIVFYGVVEDGVVRLPKNLEPPEGQLVEVHVPADDDDDDDLAAREEAFRQYLITTGRILPRANTPRVPIEPIRPDEITGTPLSEIIVAERGRWQRTTWNPVPS